MENSKIKMEEKMGLFDILKESLKIPFKNFNFIILAFFSSLPLFSFLIMYETAFQQTMIKTGKIFLQEKAAASSIFIYYFRTIEAMKELVEQISSKFVLLCLLYFCMLHLLDLLNMIVIVDVASLIYKGERPMTLGNMLSRCIKETRFKGPLITSIYVLLLDSLISVGLLSLAMYLYLTSSEGSFLTVFLVFLVVLVALLSKYIDWSAVWNMGMLISVLEDKHGDVPLVISSYLSRSSWLYRFLLMLVFFTWRLVLRLACIYVGWDKGGSGVAITVQVSLVCLAKVWLWLIFLVYFNDCKKRSSQKNTDVEGRKQSSLVEAGDQNAAKICNSASTDI